MSIKIQRRDFITGQDVRRAQVKQLEGHLELRPDDNEARKELDKLLKRQAVPV